MSYEGDEEWLCKNGHLYGCSANQISYGDGGPKVCPQCGAEPEYHHSIDYTNGSDENDPDTVPAKLEEIGFDDEWHKDHYGNEYATKRMKYKPAAGSAWKSMEEIAAEQRAYEEDQKRRTRWVIFGYHGNNVPFPSYEYKRSAFDYPPSLMHEDERGVLELFKTEEQANDECTRLSPLHPSLTLKVMKHMLNDYELKDAERNDQ